MSSSKHSVGTEVEAHCTKCKMERLHVIESLKADGTIHRVRCRTCNGAHLFRRPKGAAGDSPQKRSSSKRTKRPTVGRVELSADELARAKPYSVDGTFAEGDVIRHKTFGAGRVLDVKPGGKMEVGFPTGSKLLVCGGPR